MIKLALICTAVILHWWAYALCWYFEPTDVNRWDLMRHSIFMIEGALVWYSTSISEPSKFDRFSRLISTFFMVYVIPNDVLCNFQGDRDFHWYEVPLLAICLYITMRHIFPKTFKKIGVFLVGEANYIYLTNVFTWKIFGSN